jgi:hypothetical protein
MGLRRLTERMDAYKSYGGVGGARGDRMLSYIAIGRELEQARRERMAVAKELHELPGFDSRHKDLDETRRLLYMALLVPRTEKYELAASLVHALVHHQQVAEPVEQVIEQVLAAIDGEPHAQQWLQTQIDRVTDELH